MTNELEQRRHEQLCAYVLGECSHEERLEVESALARSPELRAQRDTIERTVGLLRSALSGSESLSPEAAETVISAASASKPGAWQSVPWMRIAAGLGAVALGVAIVQRSGERDAPQMARYEETTPALDDRASIRKVHGDADKSGLDAAKAPAGRDLDQDERSENLKTSAMVGETSTSSNAQGQPPSDPRPGFGVPHELGRDGLAWESKSSEQSIVGQWQEAQPTAADAKRPADGAVQAPKAEQVLVSAVEQRAAGQPHKEMRGQFLIPGADAGAASSSAQAPVGGTAPAPSAPVTTASSNPTGGAGGAADSGATYYRAGSGKEELKKLDNFAAPASKPSAFGARGLSGGKDVPGRADPLPPPASPAAANGPATGGAPATDPGLLASGEKAKVRFEERSRRLAVPITDSASNEVVDLVESLDREDEPLLYLKLPAAEQQAYLDRECRRILDGCVRLPNEKPRDMYFRFWGDNPFEVAALDPLSTFSADVDTASYALARRFLNEGNVPEKAQIRTEEFVNYFKSDVPAPASGVFAIQTNLAPSRFSTDTSRQMMRVVVRGKDLSKVERNRMNLTFVVDVSGSMREQNRLEMVKHSMRLLATQLDQYDRIGIVKFSTDASVVLPLTSVAERARIESAIEPLQPEGSTNSNAGLELGYAIALQGLNLQATNRVVFLSDGVANVGETDPAKIAERVKPMREKGIYLNTIGVGMNNHNDMLLEQLADKADGMCNYIDTPAEARRALVDDFTGAFQPIARDVKIQVEFDPAQVLRYRLLGYENRAIADADFRNDKVDAGELGAGHQVTALYELERQAVQPLAAASAERPLATVRVRWKEPRNFGKNAEADAASEIAHPVSGATVTSFEGAGQSYRKSVLVAQFAEILRRSIHARGDSLDDLLSESLKLQKEIPNDADFNEFVLLVSKSKDLILRTMPACDELCQAIDSVRETYYRRAQLEQLQHEMDQKMLDQLRRQNEELEARLRDIIRRRLESQGR